MLFPLSTIDRKLGVVSMLYVLCAKETDLHGERKKEEN